MIDVDNILVASHFIELMGKVRRDFLQRSELYWEYFKALPKQRWDILKILLHSICSTGT